VHVHVHVHVCVCYKELAVGCATRTYGRFTIHQTSPPAAPKPSIPAPRQPSVSVSISVSPTNLLLHDHLGHISQVLTQLLDARAQAVRQVRIG
jgi:hypothetical protein